MLKSILFLSLIFYSFTLFSQDVTGNWINYKNGKPEALIKVYETSENVLEAKVIQIYADDAKEIICDRCDRDDDRYNQPLLGMVIITNLIPTDQRLSAEHGTFLHTRTGKTYNAYIKLNEKDINKLYVRGYMGMKALGKTFIWKRANN